MGPRINSVSPMHHLGSVASPRAPRWPSGRSRWRSSWETAVLAVVSYQLGERYGSSAASDGRDGPSVGSIGRLCVRRCRQPITDPRSRPRNGAVIEMGRMSHRTRATVTPAASTTIESTTPNDVARLPEVPGASLGDPTLLTTPPHAPIMPLHPGTRSSFGLTPKWAVDEGG